MCENKKPFLEVEALAIFAVCVNDCIKIEPEWIPKEEHEKANYISWLVDHNDWKLNPVIFGTSTSNEDPIQLTGLLICTILRLTDSILVAIGIQVRSRAGRYTGIISI